MNKQNEIKSIKVAQRELADRLEALEQEPTKREPKGGDVWELDGERYIFAFHSNPSEGVIFATDIVEGHRYGDASKNPFEDVMEEATYLGKANDVLVLRSEVEKDYVSREELNKYTVRDGSGYIHKL